MHHYVKIKGVKETDQGTDLIIHIPGENIQNELLKNKSYAAEIRIDDNRRISADQRKKIYASIKDISNYTGDAPEYLKEFLKYDYCSTTGERYFSLSDCSITTAREYINHIIDFVLKENIPLSDLALNRTDDIDKLMYISLKYKRCCLCGRPGDLHHEDTIGMGSDRRTYNDSNNKKLSLCRQHHSEAHTIGVKAFYNKYHVYGIIFNER